MKKWMRSWAIPAAALALVLFLAGFLVGRASSPLAISAQTRHPTPVITTEKEPETEETAQAPAEVPDTPVQEAEAGLLDLNRAGKEDLMELPGIGEVLAGRILEYRTVSGGFVNVEQLMEVEGIGAAKFSQLLPYVTVTVEEGQ